MQRIGRGRAIVKWCQTIKVRSSGKETIGATVRLNSVSAQWVQPVQMINVFSRKRISQNRLRTKFQKRNCILLSSYGRLVKSMAPRGIAVKCVCASHQVYNEYSLKWNFENFVGRKSFYQSVIARKEAWSPDGMASKCSVCVWMGLSAVSWAMYLGIYFADP